MCLFQENQKKHLKVLMNCYEVSTNSFDLNKLKLSHFSLAMNLLKIGKALVNKEEKKFLLKNTLIIY